MRLEFPFTQHDTPAIRRRIQGDLTTIAKRVEAEDPRFRALVLTGGFSRGEGTVLDDAPVNDYDLVVIRDRPGVGPYARLHEELSRELGIDVDLLPVWHARLPHVGRKLFWLDVRLGAQVIAGDEQALAGLRRFDQVDKGEIPRLLGNRAAGLLLALPGLDETPDERQRDLQATKAALAAMDATLLSQGQYAPTMRERLALTRAHPDHRVFESAVLWKLQPTHVLPAHWWETARDTLLSAVAATRAHAWRDGTEEIVLHALRSRRLATSPSQAVRRRAWEILRESTWPQASSTWPEERRAFFEARARTLQ